MPVRRDCGWRDVSGEYGRVVLREWLKTGESRQEVLLGECVVMPNHFHGILQVNDGARCPTGTVHNDKGTAGNNKGTARRAPTVEQFGKPIAAFIADHYSFIQIHRNEMHQRNPQLSRLARLAA